MGSFVAVHGLSSCGVWGQQLQHGLSCTVAYGTLVPWPGIEPTSSALLSGSSAGKESTCSAGDRSSIPGSGRSAREGIGYPLQYSRASLVAHLWRTFTFAGNAMGSACWLWYWRSACCGEEVGWSLAPALWVALGLRLLSTWASLSASLWMGDFRTGCHQGQKSLVLILGARSGGE